MSLPIEYQPEAFGELQAARAWYDGQRPGLGNEFQAALGRTLAAIQANPLAYGVANRDVRVAPVGHFQYAVYYRVLRNRIRIIAVYHNSRDPSGWQSRR